MTLRNLNITFQLKIGIASLILFMLVLATFSFVHTNRMQTQIEDLYSHPLTVRRALASLNSDILSMRLGTRDLMLAKTDQEKQTAIQLIDVSGDDAFHQFSILKEHYLGPKEDVEEAYTAFINWKTARGLNTELAFEGEVDKVRESVKSTGAVGQLREEMLSKIKVIDDFSFAKASELYNNSVDLRDSLNRNLAIIVFLILLLSLVVNFFLVRNIRNPIEELTRASGRFGSGDFTARSSYVSKNEFGKLSDSFNSLASEIQEKINRDVASSKIVGLMLSENEAKKFFRLTLTTLAEITGSQIAAAYIKSEDGKSFDHFESVGSDAGARKSFDAETAEGEFGLALSTRKLQHLKDIPEGSRFVFNTVSGNFIPREIITIPIVSKEGVSAFISLGSVKAYQKQDILLLDNIHGVLNSRIEGVLVTRRLRKVSNELARAGAYNRSLLEASLDPLVTIGPDGKITDVNKSTELITGLSREVLIGSDFANYFSEPVLARAGYQKVFRDGFVRDYELSIRQADGKLVPVLYNATIFQNEKGEVAGVFAAARDVSDRKAYEQQLINLNRELLQQTENLKTANSELESQKGTLIQQSSELTEQNAELEMQKLQLDEANRLKTSFLSNMSHELRTPLNSVIALSGVLSRRLAKQIPEEEHSYIGVIERNGKHLLNLINDVLDISRIESGREEYELSRFDLNNLIGDLVHMIRPQAMEKSIELIHKENEVEAIVESDPDKCRHIIQNLISNAVKFTSEGNVEVSVRKTEKHIAVLVKDTGIGISEKHLPHIFDEFRQADSSTSRRYGGTGLGLAIARKYANFLGGTISVKSKPGKGSEFELFLPLTFNAPKTDQEEVKIILPGEMKPSVQVIPKPENNGKTILLVEDSEPSVIQIQDFLLESGYKILVSRNGEEALALLDSTRPDAMIIDLMMPEIDGFTLLKMLRNNDATADIPVLVLTAKHITKDDLKFLKRNKVYQLIQKGAVGRDELQAAVNNMIFGEPVATDTKIEEPLKSVRKHQKIKGRPTILVVEDNPDNMITARALLSEKFLILEATDGKSAVELAKLKNPNLILMDIALPEMDGVNAFRQIRSFTGTHDIPVIALTASAMVEDRETILSYGFDAYIPKPIDEENFFKTINDTLYG